MVDRDVLSIVSCSQDLRDRREISQPSLLYCRFLMRRRILQKDIFQRHNYSCRRIIFKYQRKDIKKLSFYDR